MSRAKALLKTYLDDMQTSSVSRWVRKTEFTEQPDGSVRRVILRGDGTVEKDEIIPTERWAEIEARAGSAKAFNKDNRSESNFSGGNYERCEEHLAKDANMVILDPDVADVFPDSASVNEALRALAGIIHARNKKGIHL